MGQAGRATGRSDALIVDCAAGSGSKAERQQMSEEPFTLTPNSPAPSYASPCGSVTLYHADCRDVISNVKADAVITDPPYGISFAAQPTTGGRKRGQKRETWDDKTPADVVLGLPVMAPICVVWGGNYYALPCTRGWLMWRKPDAPPSMAHGELAWTNIAPHTGGAD